VQTGFEALLHSVQSQCMLQPPAAVLHPDPDFCQGQQPYGPQLDSTFDSALDSTLDSSLASGTTLAPALQGMHPAGLIQSAPDGPQVQTGFEALLHSVQSQCMLQPPAAVLHPDPGVCQWQHPKDPHCDVAFICSSSIAKPEATSNAATSARAAIVV